MTPRLRRAREAPPLPDEPPFPAPARTAATVTPLFPVLRAPRLVHRLPRPPMSPRALSFAIVVVLPVAVAAIYYLLIAADQYVAEFRLSLHTADAPRIEALALFGAANSPASSAAESQIVTQFIASRAIVDELDPKLDLRRMFTPPAADWWARLRLPAPIEPLVRYWQHQVDPFYDASTGTIIVRVRAFTPADALTLARAIVAASENLVNGLSARARRDAVGHAEAAVSAAEARLLKALAAIREFRDRAGMIDPAKAADANAALATKLRDALLKANSQLATLKAQVRDDAPVVKVLKARIRALETEQRNLAREMTASPATAGGAVPLSRELGSYEPLDAERKFAEAAYQHALEGLDRARDNADRQHIYIESFVPPSLPQTALYPRRWRSLGTIALIAFAIWAIGGLAVQSIRDHL
jgi:capsular polysaccharide transport system permease protein